MEQMLCRRLSGPHVPAFSARRFRAPGLCRDRGIPGRRFTAGRTIPEFRGRGGANQFKRSRWRGDMHRQEKSFHHDIKRRAFCLAPQASGVLIDSSLVASQFSARSVAGRNSGCPTARRPRWRQSVCSAWRVIRAADLFSWVWLYSSPPGAAVCETETMPRHATAVGATRIPAQKLKPDYPPWAAGSGDAVCLEIEPVWRTHGRQTGFETEQSTDKLTRGRSA